jgi:hypothetical protein
MNKKKKKAIETEQKLTEFQETMKLNCLNDYNEYLKQASEEEYLELEEFTELWMKEIQYIFKCEILEKERIEREKKPIIITN